MKSSKKSRKCFELEYAGVAGIDAIALFVLADILPLHLIDSFSLPVSFLLDLAIILGLVAFGWRLRRRISDVLEKDFGVTKTYLRALGFGSLAVWIFLCAVFWFVLNDGEPVLLLAGSLIFACIACVYGRRARKEGK